MRTAVVSGGSGYVGSAIVRQLAADGMRVAILYRNAPEEKIAGLIADLPGSGHKAYKCDLSDPAAVEATLGIIENEHGPVYACVHAAGNLPLRKQLHLSSLEDLKGQFDADVWGAFNFLSAAARLLKKHGAGVIVGITTAAVATGINTNARGGYSPVKFAVQGMLAALKEELASVGVRVYSVAPGVMPGGLNKDTPPAFLDIIREKSPNKTLASATDVAAKISFLVSDRSSQEDQLTFLVAPESSEPASG